MLYSNYDCDVWDRLKACPLPLYLYGTGDGADKILAVCRSRGITVSGIFVSDEFYRRQTFQGFSCMTLSQLEDSVSQFAVVVAFGSHLPQLKDRVLAISARHPLFMPDVPVAGGPVFDKTFLTDHMEQFEEARSLFADPDSQKVFDQIIDYKMTGSVQPLFASESDKEEVFTHLIPLGAEEDYLDLGAYNGDTIREFLAHVPTDNQSLPLYHSIAAFEPERHSFKKLTQYVESAGLHDVSLYFGGVGAVTQDRSLRDNHGRGSHLIGNSFTADAGSQPFGLDMQKGASAGQPLGRLTHFYRIDDLSLPCSYLKIDVEGMEYETLDGLKELLTRQQPKLNIAVYHKSPDLFTLPLKLKKWLPQYQFFLRRHPCFPCWEVNLYARPSARPSF